MDTIKSPIFEDSLHHPTVLQVKLERAGLSLDAFEVVAWFMTRKNLAIAAHAMFFAVDLKWCIGAGTVKKSAKQLGCSGGLLRKEIQDWTEFLNVRLGKGPKIVPIKVAVGA